MVERFSSGSENCSCGRLAPHLPRLIPTCYSFGRRSIHLTPQNSGDYPPCIRESGTSLPQLGPTNNNQQNIMKKLLLVALFVLTCAVALPRLSAQSAMFTYTGVPAGPVNPGSSFTIGMSLVFVSGGGIPDLQGFSLWMAQRSPASGFPFSITNRDDSGSLFITGGRCLRFRRCWTQSTEHPNRNQVNTDLGGLALAPLPSGTYFVTNFTFSVAANALPGNYTIGNTTSNIPRRRRAGYRLSRPKWQYVHHRRLELQHRRGARAKFLRANGRRDARCRVGRLRPPHSAALTSASM